MEIEFTDHALLKIGQRKIPISLVRKTVLSPDSRRPGNHLPYEEWSRRFGTRHLKVIIVREPSSILVITAHWIRKVPV